VPLVLDLLLDRLLLRAPPRLRGLREVLPAAFQHRLELVMDGFVGYGLALFDVIGTAGVVPEADLLCYALPAR
jgi:hypothetical protein